MTGKISIQDLCVTFHSREGSIQAVDHVNLDIPRGKVIGLIGETGSGKSVLGLSVLDLLPSFASVQGKIYCDDVSLLNISKKEMRAYRGHKISLIPQNPSSSLNPAYRCGNQVDEAVRRTHRLDKSQSAASKTIQLLASLHLPEPEKQYRQYPFELSGGMKQRILAAIGLAASPDFLIADEPTKGLDALVRKEVVRLFDQIRTETDVGILLITHDLQVARHLCDEIAVMYAGQIVEYALADKLFNEPKHPYTQGLVASLPDKGMIPMNGPALTFSDQLSGCQFHPRCEQSVHQCETICPSLTETDAAQVRCWLYAQDEKHQQII